MKTILSWSGLDKQTPGFIIARRFYISDFSKTRKRCRFNVFEKEHFTAGWAYHVIKCAAGFLTWPHSTRLGKKQFKMFKPTSFSRLDLRATLWVWYKGSFKAVEHGEWKTWEGSREGTDVQTAFNNKLSFIFIKVHQTLRCFPSDQSGGHEVVIISELKSEKVFVTFGLDVVSSA